MDEARCKVCGYDSTKPIGVTLRNAGESVRVRLNENGFAMITHKAGCIGSHKLEASKTAAGFDLVKLDQY